MSATRTGNRGGASKAAFTAEADAICAPVNAQVGALATPNGYPALATAASTFVTTAGSQMGPLRSLQLPGLGDRGRARGVLAAMSATVDAGRPLEAGAAAGDPAMTAAASRTMAVQAEEAVSRAKDIGFTACRPACSPVSTRCWPAPTAQSRTPSSRRST